MPDETNPHPKSQITPLYRFGLLLGFAAGIGVGPRLPENINHWVFLVSIGAALFFYYRHTKS